MSEALPTPKRLRGFYPERKVRDESKFDRAAVTLLGNASRHLTARPERFREIVPAVEALGEELRGMDDGALRDRARAIRAEVRSSGLDLPRSAAVFGLAREFADRRLGMRHFDVQLIGGWVLLHGMVAEMETGEGKTLAATLPACAAAVAGVPVHVITVNDYLARRDADWMRPVYEGFGLTVGVIQQGMSLDDRRSAYRCDVTYCTNKEVAFDYLKDRLTMGRRPGEIQARVDRLQGAGSRVARLLLRGLCFAIVDEADSVLIDEARTPLIISGSGESTYEAEVYRRALEMAEVLEPGRDYVAREDRREVELTGRGKERLEELADPAGGLWRRRQRREELARQALTAIHHFRLDREYLVRAGKVHIIDEYTGRLMPDRFWEQGLHQLIETKEGCEITTQRETLARISYQRFFRRYLFLAGMTGTAREVAPELWSVYRLNVVPIPTNRPLARRQIPPRVFRTEEEKWQAVVDRIRELNAVGRPVLAGTRSVAASERLGALLERDGLPHRILNARQDKEEADIVARAGTRGCITVATNMAGRGTDIRLDPEVRDAGGLHVIATERHDARRIDRQLCGRCGRQGDPGTFEIVASLEDEILSLSSRSVSGRLASRLADVRSSPGRLAGNVFAVRAQRAAERRHFRARRELLKMDESLETSLAFSGPGE